MVVISTADVHAAKPTVGNVPAAAGKPNCQFIMGGTPAVGTTLSTCVGVLGEGLRLAKQQVADKAPVSYPSSPPQSVLAAGCSYCTFHSTNFG